MNEISAENKNVKAGKKPILTILSCLTVLIFSFGSIPIIKASLEKQLAPENFNSEDARESTSQLSVLVFLLGIVACGTIGAAVGLGLGIIAVARKERWKYLTYTSIVTNLGLLIFGLCNVLPFIS